MPPAKRAANHDPDAKDTGKERLSAGGHHHHTGRGGRRANGHAHHLAAGGGSSSSSLLRDAASASAAAAVAANGAGGSSGSGINWTLEPFDRLRSYRTAYHLPSPSCFRNPLGHAILASGVGPLSPTMQRQKAKRRVSQRELAMNIRKNFNAMGVSENEVIVALMYRLQNRDKALRKQFGATKPK